MGLGENVLHLVEYLTLTFSFGMFMDDYFTSFCLLTHLGVNNNRATLVQNKNRLHKCIFIGSKQLQKKEQGHFKQPTSSKKAAKLWFDSESSEPDRFGKKLKESIFKRNNQINSTVTTRAWLQAFCQQNGLERGQVHDLYPNE